MLLAEFCQFRRGNHLAIGIGRAFALEILTDRAADLLLDHMIGIKERKLQPPGELPPDGGFTGAGEANETHTNTWLREDRFH